MSVTYHTLTANNPESRSEAGSNRMSQLKLTIKINVNPRKVERGYIYQTIEKSSMTFKTYREVFLSQIRDGGRATYKGTNFKRGSIDAIRVILNRLQDFEIEEGREVDFEDISIEFYRKFISFLKRRGYSINSLGKAVKVLKSILHRAEEEGYHINRCFESHSFKVLKADSDSIYLTEEELNRMNELDLSGMRPSLQISRDIFMIGVWSAQRVSDYNNLKNEDIQKDGQLTILKIVQQKTGKRLVIPCNKALRDILARYPDKLPHISDQALNRNLKVLGRMAHIDDPVEIRSTKGGTVTVRTYKKYELIFTHTARRTGATLMYLSGMNVYDICKITGHSNVKTLEKYIKADALETAEQIIKRYDYFK